MHIVCHTYNIIAIRFKTPNVWHLMFVVNIAGAKEQSYRGKTSSLTTLSRNSEYTGCNVVSMISEHISDSRDTNGKQRS